MKPSMIHSFVPRLAATLLVSSFLLTGCKSAPAPAPGVRNSDGSITNADGSITYPAGSAPAAAVSQPAPATPPPSPRRNADGSTTNADGSVTYPAGSSPARREQQQATAPAPSSQAAPAPLSAPVARTIPAGTPFRVTVAQTLSASHNEPGDSFSGVLAAPLSANGSSLFSRGTAVRGTVIGSKRKGRFKGAGDLAIEITSIGGTHVSSSEYEAVAKGKGKRTGAIVGGGAGLGALIGGLAGGGKGALIGGLAGAGAGTAGAAYTGSRDVVIRSETTIPFKLTEPLTLR